MKKVPNYPMGYHSPDALKLQFSVENLIAVSDEYNLELIEYLIIDEEEW